MFAFFSAALYSTSTWNKTTQTSSSGAGRNQVFWITQSARKYVTDSEHGKNIKANVVTCRRVVEVTRTERVADNKPPIS